MSIHLIPANPGLAPAPRGGQCYAECLMSGIVKDYTALIDMSKLRGDETTVKALVENGKADRLPPIAPDAFHEKLKTGVDEGSIKFTNKGDVEVVARIYERAFLDEMSNAKNLYYPFLGWGDEEIKTLAAALTFAHSKGATANLKVRTSWPIHGSFTAPPHAFSRV